jgi:hypothetical protein
MRIMTPAIRNLRPACLAALIIVAAPVMGATPDTSRSPATGAAEPAQSATILEQLEEVVVHGRHLKEEIVKAEDEYFSLFNEVNKDDRYDTHCVYLQMQYDSKLQSRGCIPGFVADAMAQWAPYKARCQPPVEPGMDEFDCLDRSHDRRLSLQEAEARTELADVFQDLDKDGGPDGYLSRMEFTATCRDCSPELLPSAPAVYIPPTPDAVLMNGTQKWFDHMVAVNNSDPRLKKMADHLGDLYQQLSAAQHRIDELDAASMPKTGKRSTGPRSR